MVFEEDGMCVRVFDEVYVRKMIVYLGRNKMRFLIKIYYWWLGIFIDFDKYVFNCLMCWVLKVLRDKMLGFLYLFLVFEWGWKDLVVDFKLMLKDKNWYDNLMVIVDWLSKVIWVILCFVNVMVCDVVKMYYNGFFCIF